MFGTGEPRLRPLDPVVGQWIDQVMHTISPARLRGDVERLPTPRNRLHAPETMTQADALILQTFREAGWPAEEQRYLYTNVQGYLDYNVGTTVYPHPSPPFFTPPRVYPNLEGANIVAVREGTNSRDALVVLGHHDTIRDTPGADDNTASVAALLELARVLAPYRFRQTVILAATDMEELGFFGARALVERLTRERRVLGAINFETMAYTDATPHSQFLPPGLGLLYPGQVGRIQRRQSVGDFTCLIYDGATTQLAATFAEALQHLSGPNATLLLRDPNDLPVIGPLLGRALPFVRNFGRSDHVPFWETGIPALFVNDTANFRNPHYHRPTDTPDTLDYERLAAIVGATAATLARMAGLVSLTVEPPDADAAVAVGK